MPGRLSRLFSSSEKEKDALDQADEALVQEVEAAPPPYQPEPATVHADNATSPPDLTAGFSNLSIQPDRTGIPPTIACIAHLKLLEAFYRLQQGIGSTDGLFGIENKVVHDLGLSDADSTELLTKLAEKRWAIYVSRAVDRFERWLETALPTGYSLTYQDLHRTGEAGTLAQRLHAETFVGHLDGKGACITQDTLPPLDVLLVWHAYMLNPRAYFEDCLRQGRLGLWLQGFPLQAVANTIDSDTFVLEASQVVKSRFTYSTARHWDNLEDTGEKTVYCPSCARPNTSAWTTVHPLHVAAKSKTRHEAGQLIDGILSNGNGYCDQSFELSCAQCGLKISHEYLSAGKFFRDLDKLRYGRTVLPGTVFGVKGIPGSLKTKKDRDWDAIAFTTNQTFARRLNRELCKLKVVDRDGKFATMSDIRQKLETILNNKALVKTLRDPGASPMSRAERITIRRIMSRYWNNSSVFALDLVGAVVRQGTFTEKMHNIDWLHSPSLPYTMGRLLTKYTRFVKLMATPYQMAVPTLDVDLAWHTHQLMPYSYFCYTVDHTQQFIDHDDKVSELKLNEAFAWTSKTYQKTYGEPYSTCTCWYCEAVRESTTSTASRIFSSSNQKAEGMLHKAAQDPRKSVHISSHNAVRPSDDPKYTKKATKQAEELEKAYNSACSRAKSNGRKPPSRRDYYYSEAYGYPIYLPAYAPYVGVMPYTGCYYPFPPGCMAMGIGSAGNCCAGTCSALVSTGGCAADVGVGGCGSGNSGAAGGCGSSAAGCGGGGGGGCGGGGGGGCGGGGG